MSTAKAMSTSEPLRSWLVRLAVPALILIALAGWMIYRANQPAPAPLAGAGAPAMPVSAALEDTYGVRFTQVGITSDGGMVDLRYRVLDPDKAMALMSMSMASADSNPNAPKLIVEADGTEISNSEVMSMKQMPEVNSVQFVLFANPRGVLKPGMLVTIVVNQLKIEHVPVQ